MANINPTDQLCINTIRTLTIDAIEEAGCGHPGMPMGMAPAAYVLWTEHLRHNPSNPNWLNRDRFVLSCGHGSMLLYSLLYLCGYDVTLDDIKQFRKHQSKTPGHPEYGLTPGVETTTGPLGQGFANAVGMAIAQKHLAAHFNQNDYNIFDYNVYVIASDGDLMEGISYEAASLAGHLKLNNLVCLYDDNSVTIEGSTNLAFTEDTASRFRAQGWNVLSIKDGNDINSINAALTEASLSKTKPTLIQIKTILGFGSPNMQGKSGIHGSPLGKDEIILTKQNLGWKYPNKRFYVPDEVLNHCEISVKNNAEVENDWNEMLNDYSRDYPDLAAEIYRFCGKDFSVNIKDILPEFDPNKPLATRIASGATLNSISKHLPMLIGGSADLAPSVNTKLNDCPSFTFGSYQGRSIHFGIREHAMAAICNGLSLTNGLIPYCATFLVFSDYMRGAIRLSAIMKRQVIYIFTHDSICVGEDGATHQPVEHIASLRAIPGLTVIRPADAVETALSWELALKNLNGPTALILSRQNLPVIDRTLYANASEIKYGGYVLADSEKSTPELILIATGSEVSLALSAREKLQKENIHTRVVNLISWELFEKQTTEYKNKVLPPQIKNRLALEAGISMGWSKYTGDNGCFICVDDYGCSASGDFLWQKHGFNVDNVVKTAKSILTRV